MRVKQVVVQGDVLKIEWNGSVWVSPCNGQQHSRAEQAMRTELEAYYRSCEDDPSDPLAAEEIDGYIEEMADVD